MKMKGQNYQMLFYRILSIYRHDKKKPALGGGGGEWCFVKVVGVDSRARLAFEGSLHFVNVSISKHLFFKG